MTTTIPDGMPTLQSGAHTPHRGYACVMEYVSLLAGEEWGDSPACTHALIASVARSINDQGPHERQNLLPLVPRLLTANVPNRRQVQVTNRLYEVVLRAARDSKDRDVIDYLNTNPHVSVVFTFWVNRERQKGRGVAVLEMLLDEFEWFSERAPATVTPEAYTRATEQIGAMV